MQESRIYAVQLVVTHINSQPPEINGHVTKQLINMSALPATFPIESRHVFDAQQRINNHHHPPTIQGVRN